MEITFILTGVIVVLLVYFIKKYFINANDYWRKQGVPTVRGALPLIGNTFSILWSNGTLTRFCDKTYETYKNFSMIGYFQFREPNLILLDPELIKTVMIGNFSKFHENGFSIDPSVDPLLAQNPFFNSGEKWKVQRNRLSYALMSGKRLRILGHAVMGVCEKFTNYLRENVEKSTNGAYEFEGKDLGNRFTGEVVARAGFGMEGDFFVNGSGPNSFREAVQGFFEPTVFVAIEQLAVFICPALNVILRISILPRKVDRFFRRVVHEMITLRQKDKIPRNDFLQLMLDNCKDEGNEFNEEAITASATSFFVDGYETSAITLAFFAYEIATHPEVQEKLRREVKTVLESHNGAISYESLKEMTYMDHALNESMRLYPVVGFLMKKCTTRCQLDGNDGLSCIVEPGTIITIPTGAIQKDPVHWENPEIYDPERFNDERNKEHRRLVFMPFGEGPRACVGMRFALMQIKGAIATILKDFAIELSPKTKEPLQLKMTAILPAVEGGMWLNLKPL